MRDMRLFYCGRIEKFLTNFVGNYVEFLANRFAFLYNKF